MSNRSLQSRPVKRPDWITPELIEQTIEVWQSKYSRPLTVEDAVGILLNAGELVDAVQEVMG